MEVIKLILEIGAILVTLGIPFLAWNMKQAGDIAVLKTNVEWLKMREVENKGETKAFQDRMIGTLDKMNNTLTDIRIDLERKEDKEQE